MASSFYEVFLNPTDQHFVVTFQIESLQHWLLLVTFDSDHVSRVAKGNALTGSLDRAYAALRP